MTIEQQYAAYLDLCHDIPDENVMSLEDFKKYLAKIDNDD